MRRGNVDKETRKVARNTSQQDGLALGSNPSQAAGSNFNAAGSTQGGGGFKGAKSPMSQGGQSFSKARGGASNRRDLAPVGMKGAGAAAAQRKQSVEAVLEQFRSGNRDSQAAYDLIKKMEGDDIAAIVDALDQLSDIFCQATYFNKAYDILCIAVKDIQGNPVLHELIARVAFVMENFEKSIQHNKKAAQLQPTECAHNYSDIGLAYYRLGIKMGNFKYFDTAFKYCKQSIEDNKLNPKAMVNMGLIYKQ